MYWSYINLYKRSKLLSLPAASSMKGLNVEYAFDILISALLTSPASILLLRGQL